MSRVIVVTDSNSGITQSEAKELGVELLMYDAGGDVNKQISDCETLLAAGVDALVVIPQSVEVQRQ